jgi:hypothetical protein
LAKNLIAPKSKQKVLNFCKIHTPRFLGCYTSVLKFAACRLHARERKKLQLQFWIKKVKIGCCIYLLYTYQQMASFFICLLYTDQDPVQINLSPSPLSCHRSMTLLSSKRLKGRSLLKSRQPFHGAT